MKLLWCGIVRVFVLEGGINRVRNSGETDTWKYFGDRTVGSVDLSKWLYFFFFLLFRMGFGRIEGESPPVLTTKFMSDTPLGY